MVRVAWGAIIAFSLLGHEHALADIEAARLRQELPGELVPIGQPVVRAAPMSLGDFESLALANSPALGKAAAAVGAARGRWLQAGLPPNPVAGYLATEIGNEGRAGQQGAYLGQEIVTGGKRRRDRAAMSHEIRRTEAELAAERFRVITDTRLAFFDALWAQRRVEIARQLAELSRQGVRTATGLFQGQQVSEADVLQARIEAETTELLVVGAENDQSAAWRRLTAIVGLPELAPAPMAGDLEAIGEPIAFEAALSRLFASSPQIAAADAQIGRAREALSRARAERIPNLDVETAVQHDNATHFDYANVQIGMQLPIINRNQGAIAQAQAELAAAQSERLLLRNELQHRLAEVYRRYAIARERVVRFRQRILPDAQRTLQIATRGYQAGEFNYLEFLTAQRTYFQSNMANLESLRELQRSAAELDGFLLWGSLSGAAGTNPPG